MYTYLPIETLNMWLKTTEAIIQVVRKLMYIAQVVEKIGREVGCQSVVS